MGMALRALPESGQGSNVPRTPAAPPLATVVEFVTVHARSRPALPLASQLRGGGPSGQLVRHQMRSAWWRCQSSQFRAWAPVASARKALHASWLTRAFVSHASGGPGALGWPRGERV